MTGEASLGPRHLAKTYFKCVLVFKITADGYCYDLHFTQRETEDTKFDQVTIEQDSDTGAPDCEITPQSLNP